MLLTLLLLFTVLPMIEIYLLVALWDAIGLLPTLAIALGTGVLGAALARHQGLMTLARISQQLSAGKPPADSLVDGAMILLAGALLVTPGVLTDAVGFSLLIPPARAALKPLLRAVFLRRLHKHSVGQGAYVWTFGSTEGRTERRGDGVVEAEVIDVRTRDVDERPS